jgi:hypothetical protein
MKIPEHIGKVISTIKLQNTAMVFVAEHIFRFNRKLARNPGLDLMVGGFLGLLDAYVNKFHSDKRVVFKSEDIIAEEWNPSDPFVILILAETVSVAFCEQTVKELQLTLREFSARALQHGEDLIGSEESCLLNPEQVQFISQFALEFINRYEDRVISEPFLCELPGQDNLRISIQGKLNRSVRTSEESEESSFFALCDGARGDELLVYLRRLDVNFLPISSKSVIYLAESFRFTKIASAAHAEDFSMVSVTVKKTRDEKGKFRVYLKDIRRVSEEELPAFKLGAKLLADQISF